MKITNTVFKILAGLAIFTGFLTLSSELLRSQSEKPEIRQGWNPSKVMLLVTSIPIAPEPFRLEVLKLDVKETEKMIKEEKRGKIEAPISVIKPFRTEKISTQKATPQIPKVREPALLDHTELQAMVNYLEYETLSGKGVRFRYDGLLYEQHMGHKWFLKRPRDLRGKAVRIDYRGYVPREMNFRIARSETSAAAEKKVMLEDAPNSTRSILIDIPGTIPFRDVGFLEFWFDREGAGRSHADFIIEKVVVLDRPEMTKEAPEESRLEPFPLDQPFVATNLMRSEVWAS